MRCKYCGDVYVYDVRSNGYSEDHCTITCAHADRVTKLHAENERLKAELADSLPLGKVKEIANKTLSRDLSIYSEENPFSVCVRIALKDSLDEILSTLEAYVKEVQGE